MRNLLHCFNKTVNHFFFIFFQFLFLKIKKKTHSFLNLPENNNNNNNNKSKNHQIENKSSSWNWNKWWGKWKDFEDRLKNKTKKKHMFYLFYMYLEICSFIIIFQIALANWIKMRQWFFNICWCFDDLTSPFFIHQKSTSNQCFFASNILLSSHSY